MKNIITLLKPRLWPLRNRNFSDKRLSFRFLLLGIVGLVFWAGEFAISLEVLERFVKSVEGLGDIVAFKLLSMIFVISFALLIFSSILTSLSKLYLSKDLPLVHTMPVPAHEIFVARWADSAFESSWMVIVYTLPVLISYGVAFDAGPFFYLCVFSTLLSLAVVASALSSLMVMLTVLLIPASRMRSIFIFLGLTLFMLLYIAFRLLKPELLVDPDVFISFLVYMKNMQTPTPSYLPGTWAFDAVKNALAGDVWASVLHMVLSWSCAAMLGFAVIIVSDAIYFKGFSKTQTAPARLFKTRSAGASFFGFLPGPVRAFATKEIRSFLRDQTQWSQLFLIIGLVVIYVYNFKVLPLDKSPVKTVYLQNLLSFLNMGLALFVLTAITARFAYPAVSSEGEAFWLVKTAPITLKEFLWIKFFIYYVPLLILSEVLIVLTNILLHVTPFMMTLSVISVFFIVPGIVAMGVGMGAAHPDFKAENPTQTVSSFGGLLFMLLCAVYIAAVILLEAGPVYEIFMSDFRGSSLSLFKRFWIVCSFSLAFLISIFAIVMPMRLGEAKLARRFE